MNWDTLVGWVSICALIAVLGFDLVFIGFYGLFVPWRENQWGRHTMYFSCALAAPLLLGLGRLLFGEYPARREAIALCYVLLACTVAQRVFIVVRAHLRGRRSDARQTEAQPDPADGPGAGDPGVVRDVRERPAPGVHSDLGVDPGDHRDGNGSIGISGPSGVDSHR